MRNPTLASAAGFAVALAGLPSHAHHSFAAVFDANKPIAMSGTVTSVEWQNPHSWFHIDVKDDRGNVLSWAMELASPNLLMRAGWTPTTLKVGDGVKVEGFQARDGSNTGNAQVIVLTSSGRTLLGASSRTGGAQ